MLTTKEDIYLEYIAGTLIETLSKENVQSCGQTRRACCFFGAEFAYSYALYIDKRSHQLTRKSSSQKPDYAFLYALLIDKKSHPTTRQGVSIDPDWAQFYLEQIEQKPHRTLKRATSKKDKTKISYELFVEQIETDKKSNT